LDPQGVSPADPLPERLISDVETLKALSDPLRLRVLEVMVRAPIEAWTVKRIAKALGVGPTKLYHHIRILEDRELIKQSGQQLVRGIVETSYRIAQLELRLDRRFLTGGDAEVRASTHATLMTIFDLARQDLEVAAATGMLDRDAADGEGYPVTLSRTHARLSRARAAELRERLSALIHEYDDDEADADATYGVFISLHPMAEQARAGRARNHPRPSATEAP
jgi:DNA-binding transcriptional ArsR family regulator